MYKEEFQYMYSIRIVKTMCVYIVSVESMTAYIAIKACMGLLWFETMTFLRMYVSVVLYNLI